MLTSLLIQVRVKEVFRFLFSVTESEIEAEVMLVIQEAEEITEKSVLKLKAEATLEKKVVIVIMSRDMKNSVLVALQMMNL